MAIFDNADFYPTPQEVIIQMLLGVDIENKVFLEPSAGKGDIIDHLNTNGAKKVLFCENEPELAELCSNKGQMVGDDFMNLESHKVSHIDFIVMNPPFSKDEHHILHAWDMLPPGASLISLCNYETYNKHHFRARNQLKIVVDTYGSIENLGDVFHSAERKTDVEIGMIKLHKPKGEGEDEFEGYFDMSEEDETDGEGIMAFNEIRNIVNRYVGAVKRFDEVIRVNKEMNDLIKPISDNINIDFGVHGKGVHDRDSFKKELQKSAWWSVFHKMNMDKYITESALKQLNNFVEKQEKVPFTMKNIHKMIEMVVGTHGDRMNKVLVEIFDWLTERHHENRKGVEGWKTNSMYLVNRKFIAPYCGITRGYISGEPTIRWSRQGEKMDELTKSLCVLTGKNYDDFEELHRFFMPKEVPNHAAQQATQELADHLGIEYKKATVIHERSRHLSKETPNHKFYQNFSYRFGFSKEFLDKVYDFYVEKDYSEKHWGKMHETKEWGTWLDWGFFKIKVYKKGTLHAWFKDEKVWEMFNQACAKAKGWRLPTHTGSDSRRKETGVEVY